MRGDMEFRVLGSVSVRQDGAELVHAIGKPRQVLALLLINGPHRVSAKSLITELWDDAPPRRAMTTLQTHVLQLRKELARNLGVSRDTVARDLLQTHDGGYRLALGAAEFDLPEFHRLRAMAQAALNAGDSLVASRVLSEALGLWRGPVLADVEHGRLLHAAAAELDRARLETLVLFFDTRLSMNRHREILSELTRLVVRHPHHEDLHARLMLALYRSGYRVRALEVYEELCRNMHNDLGVRPSASIARLRARVAADPAAGDEDGDAAGDQADVLHVLHGPQESSRCGGGTLGSPGSGSTGILSGSGSELSTAW
ncbi:BTAD domain-containing putative transcriptional regulator [Catenulispora sp. EB89]|uniref:AfsR/SARP family transcriptional regulator n=1 Tax=Catenulispora sp. EB89 TaxID=3156257 RepID=UPI003514DEFB